jgi:hypothetical protein
MTLPKAKVNEPVDFTKWHFIDSEGDEPALDKIVGTIVQDTFTEIWAENPPCAMLPSDDPDKIIVFPFGDDECHWEFSLSELIDEGIIGKDTEFLRALRELLQTLVDQVGQRILTREERERQT